MLGIAFEGALRRSEITALVWADIAEHSEGASVHVRTPKRNQDGAKPDYRFVRQATADALKTLERIRSEVDADSPDDRIFPLTPASGNDRIKAALNAAGIDTSKVSARSLRAAHAVELAKRGAAVADIATSGGWSDHNMFSAMSAASSPVGTQSPNSCRTEDRRELRMPKTRASREAVRALIHEPTYRTIKAYAKSSSIDVADATDRDIHVGIRSGAFVHRPRESRPIPTPTYGTPSPSN